jgi:hypothetical protein
MIINFPDLNTLQLALTTGVVPPAVSLAPAVAGYEDDGRVWVEPSASLGKSAQAELRRLGVQVGKTGSPGPGAAVSCWLELLPLQRAAGSLARPDQTAILFELTEPEQLSTIVSEVLRLGNDRQSYRWVEDSRARASGVRALLRIVGPPYYSLLRALDRDGQAAAPVAYVEQAPRVWVQLGYHHPLADRIRPPQGQLLLLRPPRQWTYLDDLPFRDIYEVLEFVLPRTPTRWREGELGQRLAVPLRLARSSAQEAAELWVLRDDPVDQLDALVRNADDQLLARLAFAVGEEGEKKTIVLRARPSKLAPPELVLQGVKFRQFARLPNLFLPVGMRLHPPLRRDAVRRYLTNDETLITWLYPGPDGSFTAESLPDAAFRPLSDWIDYVLEHDHHALTAWVETARFDFESFVCDSEGERPDRPKKPPRPPQERSSGSIKGARGKTADSRTKFTGSGMTDAGAELGIEDDFPELVQTAPDEAEKELEQLVERFLAIEGGLDVEERQRLWPELAGLKTRVGDADDAGVCWVNALWSADEEMVAPWSRRWFQAEILPLTPRRLSRRGKEPSRSRSMLGRRGLDVAAEDLDRLLATENPDTSDVRALAAYLSWAASQPEPPAAVVERLGQLQPFFQAQERIIPVRIVWLGWLAVAQLAGGDPLALARARDRLLERLYHNGLRREQDLPSFLHSSGEGRHQRFRIVRSWLGEMCDKAQRWVQRMGRGSTTSQGTPQTEAYVDLTFAFGLARLSEVDASNRLLQRAAKALRGAGQAHEFLLEAYRYRIQQAQQDKPHSGPLPREQMERLTRIHKEREERGEKHGTGDWYIIDRLRDCSRILEPDQKIKPYRHLIAVLNEVEGTLLKLPDIVDPAAVVNHARDLLHKVPRSREGAEVRCKVLQVALEQAPRVSEAFALELLAQTPGSFDAMPLASNSMDFEILAKLLERGLFVAAHFGRVEYTEQLVARFRKLIEAQQDVQALPALDAVTDQCFRGLRKLGMRQQIDQLLHLMASVLLAGGDLNSVNVEWGLQHLDALRALLHVAAGWYFFGRDGQAEKIVKLARAVLLAPPGPKGAVQFPRQRAGLARAYAAALSQAPLDVAQTRLGEVFEKLEGIVDGFTTNTHYSRCQLEVVEGIVMAVVSDDLTAGSNVRRWLDEDEFLVRRRIHDDVRRLVKP